MTATERDLIDRARAWLVSDPDPDTRAELSALLERGALSAIADRFAAMLTFGTAGLRGPLGAGPNRMNRAVVRRAAAAVAAYVHAHGAGPVVIGYDARHKSHAFALDTAAVVCGAGLPAYMLPRPLPTPLLSYATRSLDCAAGVMVTASHNPASDNGYKVYLGDGAQIVAPVDEQIAAAMAGIPDLAEVPLAQRWQMLDEQIVDAYLAEIAAVVTPAGPRDLRVVYTPLHGVGAPTVSAALAQAGFAAPAVVPSQAEPDPDFPTVAFPNPEEPGALDAALSLARRTGADVVLANDPDADRLAVAVPTDAGWRMLGGDEVGVLLADALLARGVAGTYATTIVSSSLLSRMTQAAGVAYTETLTGFKWLGRVPGLSYGYEEALGYCVAPSIVADKDGISALLLLAELAATAKAEGRTLLDRLDDIARVHGVYANDQMSVRLAEPAAIDAILERLRTHSPPVLGGFAVDSVEDLAAAGQGLPPTPGLRLRLAGGGRVVVRPSGTEPKLKCYLEVVTPLRGSDVAAARIAAAGRLDAIRGDLASAAGLSAGWATG